MKVRRRESTHVREKKIKDIAEGKERGKDGGGEMVERDEGGK